MKIILSILHLFFIQNNQNQTALDIALTNQAIGAVYCLSNANAKLSVPTRASERVAMDTKIKHDFLTIYTQLKELQPSLRKATSCDTIECSPVQLSTTIAPNKKQCPP